MSGQRVAGTIDAAVAALRREQVFVTKIDALKGRSRQARKPRRGKAVPSKNLAIFTRQFSVMVDAGLPLVQCLEILGNQEEDKHFSQIILQTRTDVEGGSGLSDAMRKHPGAFDSLYSNMMAAGEAGGILDTILKRLATYIEKNVKLKAQVQVRHDVPDRGLVDRRNRRRGHPLEGDPDVRRAVRRAGRDAAAPDPDRHRAQRFAGDVPAVCHPGGVGLTFGFRRFYATERGRRVVDGALLKMPVLGGILRKVAVARFCRTLATLLGSGVPILEGLEITAKTAGNAIIEDAVMVTRAAIERGETVSGPLRETKVFPPMVTQMINVGEATGALDTMLEKVADFYEDEVDAAVAGMLTLMEPIMIAFLGVVVGGIVIAMYLPIFDLISRMAG